MDLIREWIAASAREMVGIFDDSSSKDGSVGGIEGDGLVGVGGGGVVSFDDNVTLIQIADLHNAACLLFKQGRLEEAKKLYERVLYDK